MAKRKTSEKPERQKNERVETAWLGLKVPVELFQKLDAWREQQDFTPKPSRPAAIRWIVWQFLTKQEERAARKAERK
jgi:hypothetical protein